MTAEPGKLVGGKYRLEKPLARGGMGSVWLARHTELDAPVAVKFMVHELVGTPAAEARFKREAKAAAQLRSPHVVHIHDYGVEDGAPYMVMELLEGQDLAGEIARSGRLSVSRVATIVTQVAKALAMAHAAGIVHRDLKPSNLFLSRSGEDEIVKVLDFGVAKETMTTLVVDRTTSGVLIGSPQYMSPEQARGEHVDLHSDLWSLGVVVYEAVTGAPPFDSTHLGALLAKINEASPAAPTSIAPDLPAAIDGFMARALARKPEERFPSAKALADALTRIAAATGAATTMRQVAKPVVVVPAGVAAATPIARDAATMASGVAEPDAVSTTMPERGIPKGEASSRPRRALVGAAIAIGISGVAATLWLGLGRGGTSDPGTPSATSSPPSAATPLRSPAPPVVEPVSTATATTSAPASPASPAGTTTATGPASSGSPTAGPRSSATPVRTAAAGSSRPTGAPTTTVAPAKTPTGTTSSPPPPAYDPVFGLPAQKP